MDVRERTAVVPVSQKSNQCLSAEAKTKEKFISIKSRSYPFTVDRLIHQDLSSSVTRSEKICITYFYGFNRIYVMREYDNIRSLLKLHIEIMQFLDYNDAALKARPNVGDVILAPFNQGYYRATIMSMDGTKATVKYLDIGSVAIVDIAELKRVTKGLMKIPVLGFEVKLEGVPDDPLHILKRDFEALAEQLKNKQYVLDSFITSVKESVVTLSCFGDWSKKPLSKIIMDEQKWVWETAYDTGIVNEAKMLLDTRWDVKDFAAMPTRCLPKNQRLRAQTSRVVCSPDQSTSICFVNLELDDMRHDRAVLQYQIDRYISLFKAEMYYPGFDELALAKPTGANPKWSGLKGLNRWNRCFRLQDNLYNFDDDEMYSLNDEFAADLQIRRLCPDFLQVPQFQIECNIYGHKKIKEWARKAFHETFVFGTVLDIIIVNHDPATRIYTIRCPKFEQALWMTGEESQSSIRAL